MDSTRDAVTADTGDSHRSMASRAESASSLGSNVSPCELLPDFLTNHPAFTQSVQ